MSYYKLHHLKYTFYIIFVTFGFCENKYIAKNNYIFTEGTDVHIYSYDIFFKPKICLLYGPNGKNYTKFEPDTKYVVYCGFLVRDIDISQNGQWSIVYDAIFKIINIQVTEAPVKVSVNGVALPTTNTLSKSNTANKIYFATYYYYEGDKVDVSCLSIAVNNVYKKHYVTLKYSYAETLHDVFKNKILLSFSEVGLSTTLQAVHNNSFVLCKSAHVESSHTTFKEVKVTFLLQNALNAKPITANNRNQKVTDLSNTIRIQFGTSSYSKDRIPLQLNLPENKSTIKMYNLVSEKIYEYVIYYEYEKGEHLSINCSTSLQTRLRNQYNLKFDEKVSSSASFITLDKSLTIADNNTIIKCFLYDAKHETKTIKEINLVLRMSSSRKAMAIDTEDKKKDDNNWVIYLAAGVVICFLICCSVIIYKVKKRNCYGQRKRQLRTNRGSTLRKVDASNFELHYSVPNDQTVNNSYHQYVNSNFQTDITYADLDLSTPNEVTNKVDNERAIYAEINHNVG